MDDPDSEESEDEMNQRVAAAKIGWAARVANQEQEVRFFWGYAGEGAGFSSLALVPSGRDTGSPYPSMPPVTSQPLPPILRVHAPSLVSPSSRRRV
jgi:hypothetical protein